MPEENLWSLISHTLSTAGSIERAVFFLLVAFSLASWAILLIKLEEMHSARKNGAKFLDVLNNSESFGSALSAGMALSASPLFSIFKAAVASLEGKRPGVQPKAADPRQIPLRPTHTEDMLRLDMQQAASAEFSRLQRGLGFLATTGSTSPFIGLFGTVWGIMTTFRDLGAAKSASLAVVAPGISSALIATAAGLAVAIPAVMAYNWFLAQVDSMQERSDAFIEHMVVLVRSSGYLESGSPAAGHAPAQPVLQAQMPPSSSATPMAAAAPRGPQA